MFRYRLLSVVIDQKIEMEKIITLEENVKLVYEEAALKVLDCTPQLYIFSTNEKNSLKPIGSSVLFHRNKNYYLITAGHCIQQDKSLIKVGILISGHLHFLKGEVLINNGKGDQVDIAVLKLSHESISICMLKYKFQFDDQILPNKNIDIIADFLVLGYPLTKTFINHKEKKIKYEPFVLIAKSKELKVYTKLGFDNRQNIL